MFDKPRTCGVNVRSRNTVEEHVALDKEPEARAVPMLFMDMRQDLGRIEPHKGRFPSALEDALFFLLLAPWETWSTEDHHARQTVKTAA
jgi:hypothetical protein